MSDFWLTLSKSFIFWLTWIIIPIIMEIIPAIVGFFVLLAKKRKGKVEDVKGRLPELTIIVPVYNSHETLFGCIQSIDESEYPSELIEVYMVNNKSPDNSFEIFTQAQDAFPELSMQWLNAKQGKSKALNMALFNARGKYIIHIDSDGTLEKHALYNMVKRFENDHNIHCMTGAILINPDDIERSKSSLLKFFRRSEFFEYAQAFLAGRNYQSELDSIFTLSGAFSAFRKSTILKTQLYNTDTVGEDTQITFQIKKQLKQKVYMCEDALFFVDPIEDFNKIYTQRQRWQRGELEVFHMFFKDNMSITKGFFSNFMIRLIVFDHTFAFPRMIWYFALICLLFMNYPMKLVFGSIGIIYVLYIFTSFLYYLNILTFLRDFKDIRKYYASKWYLCIVLPLYNFLMFWVRFAGIINSINSDGMWKTKNLHEERRTFSDIVKNDFYFITKVVTRLKEKINNRESDEEVTNKEKS